MFKMGGRKWIVPSVAALLMVLLIVPVAHAGILWSGIDPIFEVKGHRFNVFIEWPSEYTCSIEDPIQVRIRVPEDSSYVFISESSDDVGDCGSPQRTVTRVKFDDDQNEVRVRARVRSEFDFPVKVKVFLDGDLVKSQMGESNRWTRNARVEFDGDDDDDRGKGQDNDRGKGHDKAHGRGHHSNHDKGDDR